jgi:multiple sugar transport system permease protein
MKNKKKIQKYAKLTGFFLLALLFAIFFSAPFVYMAFMALMKDSNAIFQYPPTLYSGAFYFSNFVEAWKSIDFGQKLLNTLGITFGSMLLGISSSVLIAYGFTRYQNRFSNFFFMVLLSTMMIPWVVTMIPAYAEYEFLGWIGTVWPLIIPWIGGSAFNIFLLRQFMMGIPKELDEAAEIDGCNSFQTLLYVLLPNMKPVLATLFVFSFINGWSDYIGPSIYLQSSPELFTLSLGMQQFFSSTGSANWAYVMAASILFSVPMILVISFAQKAFIRGVVNTGIK